MATPQFFHLTIEGLSSDLRVVRFEGREGMSELFEFEVEFACDDPIDLDSVIEKPGVLELVSQDGSRYVHGIVSRFEEIGGGQSHTLYLARLVPALWAFGLTNDCCIYQTIKVPDVIKDILQSGGMEAGTDFRLDLKGSYVAREYVVQYRESDLDFITRLMEEAGIFYFFEHTQDGHVLVLGDHTGAHADIEGTVVLPFHADDSGMQGTTEEVSGLRMSRSMRTGKVSMRSFNFEKNKLKLEAESSGEAETGHEHYDFDGRYADEAAGKEVVRVRQESFAARRRILSGDSNCRHMTPGFKFAIEKHPNDDFNADFLLTSVEHKGTQPQAAGGDGAMSTDDEDGAQEIYANEFEAVPATVVFRPLQLTEPALVDGPQTAVVTGPAGEEIYCDSHGRVKVMFHWDRYGTADDKASCWMRVAQSHRIADFAIPRIGEEVIVDFLEGDPDQPIITGRVYNGTNQTPYALPGEKTKSTFRTPSSPGRNGFNELRFEDSAGSEEVFFHAQKDMNIKVLNNRTQDIGADNTHHVGHDEVEEVGNNRTRKVGVNEVLEVGADQTETIGANRTESVGANETVNIGANRSHTIGGSDTYTVALQHTIAVGVNQSVAIGAAQEVAIGAAQSITVGANQSTSVGADASLTVGAKLTTDIGADSAQTIGGALSVKVGKKVLIEAADELKLVCGSASIILKKSGDVVIQGGKIDMKADGNIKIKGSQIAGN